MLHQLQQLLADLYDIEVWPDVRDFVVTDSRWRACSPTAGARTDTGEQLLIEEGADEIGLALYLDPAVLARLEALSPADRLLERHRADFFLVLEGISHFNYVAWNAAHDKPVTLLELEMQAEIDKYIGACALDGAPDTRSRGALLGHLFAAPGFDPELGDTALGRYQHANHLAGRYCHSLASRYPAGLLPPAMLRELRAFYRWPQPAKVSHIHTAVFA